jgi:hypothetical protein
MIFSRNSSQFLVIYFELFSYESKFNSEIADMRGPPVSRRFPCRACLSACRHRVAAMHPRAAPLARAHPDHAIIRVYSRPSLFEHATVVVRTPPPSRALPRRAEPEPPLAAFFFRGMLSLAPSPSTPMQDRYRPPEPWPHRRTLLPIRFISPSPSTRSSSELSPPPPCPAGSLSAVGARAPSFAPPPPL